ncbi:MAG: glycosyltransferase family 39 protein [Candidatus Omnitrophota bacterium]
MILLISLHLINIIFWFKAGAWPVGKDWYWHMHNTFKMMHALNQNFSFKNLVFIDTAYAPLYYWTGIILVKIFSANNALFFNSAIFFTILLSAIYGLGKKLSDKQTGVLAAIICSFFAIIYTKSIQYNFNIAITALVSVCAYLLLLTNNFQNFKFSVFAGISFGLALLIRQSAIIFLFGPIFTTILTCKADNQLQNKNKFFNIFVFIFLSIFIAAIFYHCPQTLSSIMERTQHIAKVQEENIFSLSHLFFYIKILPFQIGWLNCFLFIMSIYSLRNISPAKRLFLLSWLVIPFIILTFIRVKEFEFSMPYLPVFALCLAVFYNEISKKTTGKFLVILMIIISMCKYFISF